MKKKLSRFLEVLDEYGEFFFSNGSIKKDYEFVDSVLKRQGYWSGTSCRFYFDNDWNLAYIEGRF